MTPRCQAVLLIVVAISLLLNGACAGLALVVWWVVAHWPAGFTP